MIELALPLEGAGLNYRMNVNHGRTQPKIAGGGAVRGSEGHPADDDDLASEKGHLLAERALFSTITWGGSCPPAPPPR